MRSLFTFVLWVLTVTLFVEGCTKKTYEETLPQVNFVSVVPYGNDSAIITGNVSSAGASPIEYVGFAYSTTPSFDILSNQILGNGTLGQFSAQIKASQDSTYYFKCFAANSYGYKVSQVFKYTVGVAAGDSAPCSVTANTFTDDGFSYNAIDINTGAGYVYAAGSFGVEYDDGSSQTITIDFNGSPGNGVYTTVPDLSFDNNPYDCEIVINGGSAVANAGDKVYISKNGTVTTLSYCSIPYTENSSNYNTSAKIRY